MADGSDITERLRELAKPLLDGERWSYPAATLVMPAGRALHDAADLIERLRAQAPGWRGMESAPKEEIIWVWCPPYAGLDALTSLCQWHEDAGFCVDKLRTPTAWQILPIPSPPAEGGE